MEYIILKKWQAKVDTKTYNSLTHVEIVKDTVPVALGTHCRKYEKNTFEFICKQLAAGMV
jgi:hypothetical protein